MIDETPETGSDGGVHPEGISSGRKRAVLLGVGIVLLAGISFGLPPDASGAAMKGLV
jgi:hypothetical protein